MDTIETRANYLNFINYLKNKDRKCIDIEDDIISCSVERANEFLLDIIFNSDLN
jgi:hypothetical protein